MIYQKSAKALAEMLAQKELSSEELVKALHQRADEVEGQIHGFTHQLREQSLEEARLRDQERARGALRGPLHGLPLTIKDNIDVGGTAATLGVRARAKHRAAGDAVIVQAARDAGMVILGKSNIPQGLVSMRGINHVYGESSNPWSAAHVTGGSSSGEGALVASGASVFGIGSDLGGSIRFPAGFCGIAGLKPTYLRWSNKGVHTAIAGQEFVRSQIGPMARTTGDLRLLMEGLSYDKQAQLDPQLPPLQLSQEAPKRLEGMRIGYFLDDGFIAPATANVRAVREAVSILREAGATLVEVTPSSGLELVQLYLGATSSDGLETLRALFQGEAVVPPLQMTWRLGRLPAALQQLVARMMPLVGERRLGEVMRHIGPKSAHELWQLNAKRQAFVASELDWWQELGLDALVCPASASPAVPVGMGSQFSLIFSYYARFNLLGWPAGVVPVTTVQPSETVRDGRGPKDSLERRAALVQAKSKGLPVGVQVATMLWQEETLLDVMQCIEEGARAHRLFPTTPIDPR